MCKTYLNILSIVMKQLKQKWRKVLTFLIKYTIGYSNRSIGSTLMNATSSRAHTIITIEFKQIITTDGHKQEKFSVINLVDLAGSEKAG